MLRLFVFLVLVMFKAEASFLDDPPQTILVNNMALQAVRPDLSEKDVDFTAEYEYADGDIVNVACVNFFGTARLTMEYPMADTLSDKFTSGNLSSSQEIGFYTKLHSGHNNSYMTCTSAELTDYTKVMVRFVMRTEFNIVRVKIDGMTLRPKLYNMDQYRIYYYYLRNRPIKVVCEVKRDDVVLVVTHSMRGFVGGVNGYNETELNKKKSEMSFKLNGRTMTLLCGSDYIKGGRAELITIKISESLFPIERPPHMKLPPNGTVMELYDYDDDKARNAIFYEFEDGERLQLKCGPLHSPQPGPVLYLQFQDSKCNVNSCYVTQNLTITNQHDNSEIVCRSMEENLDTEKKDVVIKEIRVILRKRVLSTTTTTTSTTTTTTTATTVQPTEREKSTKTYVLAYSLSAVGVLIIVVVLLLYLKARKRCCYGSRAQEMPLPRPDPASVYYENTLEIFAPVNQREAEAMENHYEEIQ